MHVAGLPRVRRPSTGADLLKIIISLNDFPQLVFQSAVATIGVGMVTFHQFLEARLDLRRRRRILQPEGVKGLALGIVDSPPPFSFGAGLRRALAGSAELPQDVERIRSALAFVKKPADLSLCPLFAADCSHTPSRQMSRERVLLITRNRVVAHPGEEIVGLIVLAHVGETESPVLTLTVAPFRRAVACLLGAIRP